LDTQSYDYQKMIERYRGGDYSAIEPIIEMFSPELYKFFYFKFYDAEKATELVDEVFWRFKKATFGQAKIAGEIGAWFHKVAKNLAIDEIRKKYRHPSEIPLSRMRKSDEDETADFENVPDLFLLSEDDLLTLIDLHHALHRCLCRFQPEVRAVLLAYLCGLNLRQIAEILETESDATDTELMKKKLVEVNNMWTRNRKRLWDCIKREYPEIGAWYGKK